MKEITLIHWNMCPYCVSARKYINELYEEFPQYKEIPLVMIEENEQPQLASKFTNYYYVPSFFIEGENVAEGVLDKNDIKAVFEKALA